MFLNQLFSSIRPGSGTRKSLRFPFALNSGQIYFTSSRVTTVWLCHSGMAGVEFGNSIA